MKILLGFFICFVFINAASPLECEVCAGTGTSCNGEMEVCEDGKDTCAVIVSDSSVDRYVTKTVVKSCTYSQSCTNETQYLEYGTQISQRAGIACCQGNSCRTALPELSKPLNDTQRNGKHCPACFGFLFSTCKEGEMVECRGPEDRCIDMEATIGYGPVVLTVIQKGCVTKEICSDLSLTEVKISGIRSKLKKAACKEAALRQPTPPSSELLSSRLE